MQKTIEELQKKVEKLEERVRRLEINTTPDSDDVLLDKAKKLVMGYEKVGVSLLQRMLVIGYARAARILDQLERDGYISGGYGSKPRVVLKKL